MQYLKDSQRVEDRSGGPNGSTPNLALGGGGVDFESLVGGGAPSTQATSVTSDNSGKGWDDDVWGSILADTPVQVSDVVYSENCLALMTV
jgi:SCY1-like protein 2